MARMLKVGALTSLLLIGALCAAARGAQAQDLDMKKIFRCSATDKSGIDSCDRARTMILDNCTSCHAFVPIVLQQFDQAGWKGLFDRHRGRTPQLDDQQLATIETYLAANFNGQRPPPDLPPDLLKQWTAY